MSNDRVLRKKIKLIRTLRGWNGHAQKKDYMKEDHIFSSNGRVQIKDVNQ